MPLSMLSNSLVFIDSAVNDYQHLVNGVIPTAEVFVLDADRDGIDQITTTLAGRSGIKSLHIVSHGESGRLQLGLATLSLETLERYASQLQHWSMALSPDADLVLYGCNVAAGDRGINFVRHLSILTGVPVAASTHLTGNRTLGGSWNLDYRTGTIHSPLAFQPETIEAYSSVLVAPNLVYANVSSTTGTELRILDLSTGRSFRVGELTTGFSNNIFAIARDSTTGRIYYVEGGNNGRVAFFDPTTGTNTLLPQRTGINRSFVRLAQAQDRRIYGMSGGINSLFRIDTIDPSNPNAGIAQDLGPITGILPGGSGDMAFDPTNANRFFVTITGNGFYRLFRVDIDPATSQATAAEIGDNVREGSATGPILNGVIGAGSFVFGQDGQLYASSNGNLYQIDATTAIATLVGPFNISGVSDFSDFASLPASTTNASLTVTNTDGLTSVNPGSTTTYTVTVTTPVSIEGGVVINTIPPEVTNVSWTASISAGGGAFVQPIDSAGTGNEIVSRVNLTAGAVVTYTITGTVSPTVTPGTILTSTAIVPGLSTIITGNSATDTTNINTPPNANTISVGSVTPGTTVAIPALSAIDPDGDPITSFRVTPPLAAEGTLFLGNPALGGTAITTARDLTPAEAGQLFFTPAPTFTGGSFTYTATDSIGAVDPTPATVSLSASANNPPIATPLTVNGVTPGTTIALPPLSASDPDGNPIASFTITPPSAAQGTLFLGNPALGGTAITTPRDLTPAEASQLFFTPAPTFTGGGFSYTARDSLGATSLVPATVTLASSANNSPVGAPITVSGVTPGTTVAIPPLSATDPDGDAITTFRVAPPPASQGTLFLGNPASGGVAIATPRDLTPTEASQLFFTPAPTFTGGGFTYTATDTRGATSPTAATVTLTTIPNNPPVVAPITVDRVTPGTTVAIPPLTATDPDGDAITFRVTPPPTGQGILFLGNPASGGTAITAPQTLTPAQASQLFFTPAPTFTGGGFTYTAIDSRGATSTASTSVTLITGTIAGNQPPTVSPLEVPVTPGVQTPLPPLPATDPDSPISSFTILTIPPATQGTLVFRNPGSGRDEPITPGRTLNSTDITRLVFIPTADFEDETVFTYTATDVFGATSIPSTVTLFGDIEGLSAPPDDPNCADGIRRRGTNGRNTLTGTPGSDTLLGLGGNDRLFGLACDDLLDGRRGNDLLRGGNGNDTLRGRQNNDRLFGGNGIDFLFGNLGRDRLSGGNNSDRLSGGFGSDRLDGGNGNDILLGGRGNDTLLGGRGRDRMDGGRGQDRLSGHGGNDIIAGRQGNDRLSGGANNDQLSGNLGRDFLNGNNGDDILRGGKGRDRLRGGKGRDILDGGRDADRLLGERGRDTLLGRQGNDTIIGGLGWDTLSGNLGRDTLDAGPGRDTINGGYGNDVIVGGVDSDLLSGGAGRDRFVYRTVRDGIDTITDFSTNELIDLKRLLSPSTYGRSQKFAAYVRLRQSSSNTIVRVDLNGDAAGGFSNFIILENVSANTLSARNFIVS